METVEARLAKAREALAGVQRRVGTTRERWEAPVLPLAPVLDQVLPEGLRRGRVVAVDGSTSLLLALAAEASRAGAWTAFVGLPSVGVVAAARRGIDLDRVAAIPHPGAHAAAVAGACVEGMELVLLGTGLALSDADRRRLASRARERGAVLLCQGRWPGAHATVTALRSRWHGLGAGDGRLRGRDLTVQVEGRNAGAPRFVTVPLDGEAPLLGRGGAPGRAAARVSSGASAGRRALGGAA
ncbi:hypothetical protein [Demequina pelophila]|uniref:hypothetical protein n=1 Tax=Demequina pelophila TaxID=1638984 RepID=UPI000785B79C|nr:hypothetical protein [Demequina pelophila]